MRYRDFIEKVKNVSYFKTSTLQTLGGNLRTIRNQLPAWQRTGKIIRLRNGVYTLGDRDRQAELPPFLISNILYAPSYVSLESALEFYGLIPERSVQVTAISSRKTMRFKNHYGLYLYQSIKPQGFFGFETIREEGMPVLVATPEKALLDKIYLDPQFRNDEGYFLENLRLQDYQDLNSRRLRHYSVRFASRKVSSGVRLLVTLIREERRRS
jgi:predicted transcriptional regulator of viral defense system